MPTSSASVPACCRRAPRSRSPCSRSCSSSWWCNSSTSVESKPDELGDPLTMIEGALWRRWVFYNIPLILFVFVLLFPFYWMIITTFRPDGELYRPWNAVNNMPFWTNHPTLEHIVLVRGDKFRALDAEHDVHCLGLDIDLTVLRRAGRLRAGAAQFSL